MSFRVASTDNGLFLQGSDRTPPGRWTFGGRHFGTFHGEKWSRPSDSEYVLSGIHPSVSIGSWRTVKKALKRILITCQSYEGQAAALILEAIDRCEGS